MNTLATFIIRSCGERTENLCKKLIIDQGISQENIFIVNEKPFSKSLRRSLEIGIAQNRKWIFCVDADVLLCADSINHMLRRAEKKRSNVCEIQGYMLDKFFGLARPGGVHLYRTSLAEKVLAFIPEEGVDIRPETFALNKMAENGYPWHIVPEIIGLHDFEQSSDDIYRKCFVYAHKHLSHTQQLVNLWRSEVDQDSDYGIALKGFSDGIRRAHNVRIDKNQTYFDTNALGLLTKESIELKNWNLQKIDQILVDYQHSEHLAKYQTDAMIDTGSHFLRRIYEQFKWFKLKYSLKASVILLLYWILGQLLRRSERHKKSLR